MDNFNIHSFYKKQYLAEALADNVDKIQISYTDPGFRFYGMYLTKLDKIVDELKRLGIKASHDAAMDTT